MRFAPLAMTFELGHYPVFHRLDFPPLSRPLARVIRFGRFLLFALLTLWLPATMHCRLEAAGFFEAHDGCAAEQTAANGTDCKDDACPTVEDALYKESTHGLTVSAPAECFLPDGLALRIEADATAAAALLSPTRHAPPPELAVTWQFIARAAPPARAPSLNS